MLTTNHCMIEQRTLEVGRDILSQVNTRGPMPLSRKWLDDRLMQWSMNNESLKVEMFRFIDVLATLDDPDAIAEHVQAYLNNPNGRYPFVVRWMVWLAQPGTMIGRLLARFIRHNTSQLARRFIAGENPREVIQAVEVLRHQGMGFTLDLLGEAIITEKEADDYMRQYLELLDALSEAAGRWPEHLILDQHHGRPLPRVNVSIKASAFTSQFDPIDPAGSIAAVSRRLREILRAARRHSAFVNLDMEQYELKDLTLALFRQTFFEPEFRDWPDVGIALQAYLRDTERDLSELLEWARTRGTPIWVRLVKGAYWDYGFKGNE